MRDQRALQQRIGRNIKQSRLGRGLTQEDLADLAEKSAVYIRKLEAGRSNPTVKTLNSIASALALDACDLMVPTIPERSGRPDIAVSATRFNHILKRAEQLLAALRVLKRKRLRS